MMGKGEFIVCRMKHMKLPVVGQFDLKMEISYGSNFWSLILHVFDLLLLLLLLK